MCKLKLKDKINKYGILIDKLLLELWKVLFRYNVITKGVKPTNFAID